MRKVFAMSLFVILTVAVSSSGGRSPDQDDDALRALVPKIVAAWGTLNIANVDPFYAKDADFTYFDIAPMRYNNWQDYRENVQKLLFEPNRSITAKINDDLRVHRRGSLAWATFTLSLDIVSKQAQSSHIDGRWTMVLEKRPTGWIVVHEHVSAPLPGS